MPQAHTLRSQSKGLTGTYFGLNRLVCQFRLLRDVRCPSGQPYARKRHCERNRDFASTTSQVPRNHVKYPHGNGETIGAKKVHVEIGHSVLHRHQKQHECLRMLAFVAGVEPGLRHIWKMPLSSLTSESSLALIGNASGRLLGRSGDLDPRRFR